MADILEAKTILLDAAAKTGWSWESMLDVVCDFINDNGLESELKDYVDESVEIELEDPPEGGDDYEED
jgi:hypothetical protein